MHKILTAAAILALLSQPAALRAATMNASQTALDQDPEWIGYYIGQHIGAATAKGDFDDGRFFPGVAFSNDSRGVVGGGTIGYNYPVGRAVIGGEVDFGGMGVNGSARQGAISANFESGFYADATARLGFALGPALVFVKGGYAYYAGGVSATDGVASARDSGLSGYTAGGGIEYKVEPAWSVKGEYQYFDFGSRTLAIQGGAALDNRSFTINTFKLGVNYHFCN